MAQPSDERRPLLENNAPANNGALEHGGGSSQNESGNSTGSFLAAVDSTMVATLTAPISASFHSLSLLSWLASAYFIANAALQPLSGKLTDIFGRRAGLVFSNLFFAAGNLMCGLATEEWQIIAGRVVAGMGGGGLTAISTFVGSDLVPLRRRGVWQGVGNVVFGVGSGVGGIFGGWINDTLNWRWSFLILVPFTVISCLLVIFVSNIPGKHEMPGISKADENEDAKSRWKRIDGLGAALLIATLVLMLLGLNSGGNVVPWDHPLVLTTLPLSFLGLLAFIYVEAYVAEEPVIPVRLLLNRTVLAACMTNWFVTMSLFGLLFYGPIYFQIQGFSATQAGERIAPYAVGVAAGSVSVGMLMRRLGRYYILNIAVVAILLVSFGLISSVRLDTPVWPPFIYFFLAGLGYSGMLTVTLIALISAVEHHFQAVITAASYAFRSTGSTIGITIASSVFQNILRRELWSRLGEWKGAHEIIPRVRDSLEELERLPQEWQDAVRQIYMDALRGVFLTLFGLVALGGVCALFMREHKLHTTISRRDSR